MYERIEKAALELGFARVCFLPPGRLGTWRARAQETGFGAELPYDIAAAYPWAGSIALLIYPYRPYKDGERIPAYYISSNRAYRAAKALAAALNAEGARCEYALFPYRALAHACGVGDIGKNGLLHLAPYGSRIVLQALAVEGLAPRTYDEPENRVKGSKSLRFRRPESTPSRCCRRLPCGATATDDDKVMRQNSSFEAQGFESLYPNCPKGCDACARACPSGAISETGLDVARCMRAQMEGALRSDEVKRLLSCHVGCERCMLACPLNAALLLDEPDAQAREAFDLRRLIAGDASAARKLVGKNMTSSGKLTAEAIVFAARQGLYENEIRAALFSPFEAVRDAAAWALKEYFN